MSGTLHFQIRDRVQAILAAGAGLVPADVHAGRRTRPMPERIEREIHVYLDFSKPERAQLMYQPDDWMTRIRIECAARASGTQTGEQRADDLARACYGLLAVDPSLGGLCIDLVPVGLAWDSEEADLTLGVTQVLFDARHRTPATSVAAP